MQNQLSLTASVGKPRGDNPTVFVSDKGFAATNVIVVSTDIEGRTTKAYMDLVAFNGVSDQLKGLNPGDCIEIKGRLESHKREDQPWRLRLVADKITSAQLNIDSEEEGA